jgi:small GTP-binding protein
MFTSGQPGALTRALDELWALGADQDRESIEGLRRRLAGQRLRVLVAGEAKRGKSTLVNALLGRAVLPAGVTPLTALATTVRYGAREGVTVVLPGGLAQECPLSALDDLVTERGNPGNEKNLSSVTVLVDAPLLARGVELVDTPGTGSVYGHNTIEAQAALKTMDAAVFVLTADPPVSASERELIAEVASLSVTMFVVLNKADHLSADELGEVVDFTADVVAEAAGRPVRIYPVSARAALASSGDAGFDAFETDFAAYLERGRADDLRRSVEAHARRIAFALRDEAVLARRAAQLRGTEAAERVRAFAARLAVVQDRRRDAADLVGAESSRMLADLNLASGRAERDRFRRVSQQLAELLDGTLRAASATEIERAGRAQLGELAVTEAEAWRSERAGALEAGLAGLDKRLTAVLRAELDAVRQAAADLLGLDLTVATPGQRLAPDLPFFYQVAEHAGQTELLAGAIRRRLPGEAGRARAREHLRRETADLVPRQIGRARADLQYRLQEATRRLMRAIDDRYLEGTGRLEKALADADGLRSATAEEVATRNADLARRLAAIDHALGLLGPETSAHATLPGFAAGASGPAQLRAPDLAQGARPYGMPGRAEATSSRRLYQAIVAAATRGQAGAKVA